MSSFGHRRRFSQYWSTNPSNYAVRYGGSGADGKGACFQGSLSFATTGPSRVSTPDSIYVGMGALQLTLRNQLRSEFGLGSPLVAKTAPTPLKIQNSPRLSTPCGPAHSGNTRSTPDTVRPKRPVVVESPCEQPSRICTTSKFRLGFYSFSVEVVFDTMDVHGGGFVRDWVQTSPLRPKPQANSPYTEYINLLRKDRTRPSTSPICEGNR
eukprot:1098031-Prorocentrum_minimum.AAC.1